MAQQLQWTFREDAPVRAVSVESGESGAYADIETRVDVQAYLWVRTYVCRQCSALVPTMRNPALSRDLAIRMIPDPDILITRYKVVPRAEGSRPNIARGIAHCPHCGTTTRKGFLASEARAGRLGHVHYCSVYRVTNPHWLKSRRKWVAKKGPVQFRVPAEVELESRRVRVAGLESLRAGGFAIADSTIERDPSLLELGLFGSEESEYAPGVERLGLHDAGSGLD